MLIGSRSGFVTLADREEEMYKEMFKAVMSGMSVGQRIRLYDPDITYIVPNALSQRQWRENAAQNNAQFEIDFPNAVQCGVGSVGNCFDRCGLVSVNLPKLQKSYGTYQFAYNYCVEISLPLLENFSNHDFSFSTTLKTLRLPSVTSKSGNFFVYNCTVLEDVYLDSMTLSQLGGASYIAQQACNSAAVFHLADGDYDYQGNPITSNSNGGGGHKCLNSYFSPFSRSSRLWKEAA